MTSEEICDTACVTESQPTLKVDVADDGSVRIVITDPAANTTNSTGTTTTTLVCV